MTPPDDPRMPDVPDPTEGSPPCSLERALDLVRFLRANCSWDAAQTPVSLVPYLLEEAHEAVDAIHDADDEHLEGELGDLLLNLAFQLVLGEERGAFTAESVAARLDRKMRSRHPHLYGLGERSDWETLKARERADGRVLGGLVRGLDPLTQAHRMQERVSAVGFDWKDYRGASAKVDEELEEVRSALEGGSEDHVTEELGDLLFAVVNLVRLAGAHPTTALDAANRKFLRRFERLEDLATQRGMELAETGLEDLDVLWEEIKDQEK